MLLPRPGNEEDAHRQQGPQRIVSLARSAKSSAIVDVHIAGSVSRSAKNAQVTEPLSHGESA